MLEFYQRYLRRKHSAPIKKVKLEWRDESWCYVLQNGESIGHLSFYITDDDVRVKIINVLKQLEK